MEGRNQNEEEMGGNENFGLCAALCLGFRRMRGVRCGGFLFCRVVDCEIWNFSQVCSLGFSWRPNSWSCSYAICSSEMIVLFY